MPHHLIHFYNVLRGLRDNRGHEFAKHHHQTTKPKTNPINLIHMNTPKKTIHYFIVADRSGSMSDQIDEVRQELYHHVREMKKTVLEKDVAVRFHLSLFDSEIEWLSSGTLIQDFDSELIERYVPGGMTALFDAVGQAIERAEYKIGSDIDPEREEVAIMVFSDGGENASQKFHSTSLSALIEHVQHKPGWTITFTGCDAAGFSDIERSSLRKDRMLRYKGTEKSLAFKNMMHVINRSVSEDDFIYKKPFTKE